MCVSSTPANCCSASTFATELPTVPKPTRAIFTEPAPADLLVIVFAAFLIAMSVFDLIRRCAPLVKTLHCLIAQQSCRGNFALGNRFGYLFIEERVIKSRSSSIRCRIAVEDGVAARPVERGQAHGAGLATGVNGAAGELKAVQRLARRADRSHFRMRRRIIHRSHLIGASGDNLAVTHHHAAEWSPATRDVFRCEGDRPPHELWIWFDRADNALLTPK